MDVVIIDESKRAYRDLIQTKRCTAQIPVIALTLKFKLSWLHEHCVLIRNFRMFAALQGYIQTLVHNCPRYFSNPWKEFVFFLISNARSYVLSFGLCTATLYNPADFKSLWLCVCVSFILYFGTIHCYLLGELLNSRSGDGYSLFW